MAAYQLTRREVLTLCVLLHLPVQEGSVLYNWLGVGELAAGPSQEDLDTLEAKGCYHPSTPATPFRGPLVSSMTVAALNAAELTVTFASKDHAGITRFCQVGEGLVEFGTDGDDLYLHQLVKMKEMVGGFLPEWFAAQHDEQAKVELQLGAYLLFKQACLASDLAFVESHFKSRRFEKNMLVELFKEGEDWVDIFNAEGLQGVMSIEQMPVEVYLNQLLSMGYLQGDMDENLEIGAVGKALKEVLSDPDLCSLTCSMHIWEAGYPETGSILYGGGRLFLLITNPGIISIHQLASREAGLAWIEQLLAKGSLAHHTSYVLSPIVTGQLSTAAQPRPAAASAGKRNISRPFLIGSVAVLLLACCLACIGAAVLLYGRNLPVTQAGIVLPAPTADAAPTNTDAGIRSCPGTQPTRLNKDDHAQVVNVGGYSLIFYDQPRSNANEVGSVPEEYQVIIRDGPVCAESAYWWQVEFREGGKEGWGWAPETSSDGTYLLEQVP